MPSPTYTLAELRYREAKRRIFAKFVNESDRQKYSCEFHPCFTLKAPSAQMAKKLGALIGDFSIGVIQEGQFLKVFCETFKELKKAYVFLCNATEIKPVLLEAERQFLLQKGWSYFDGFVMENEPKKLNHFIFNECIDYDKAAILANLLSIMPEDAARLTNSDAATVFLENVLYASCEPLNNTINCTPPLVRAKFDAKLLAHAIIENNIGFETLNCDCCKPHSIEASNVLGSSFVVAKFMQNAFFFNSAIPCYANLFHRTHTNKQSREIRKREYSLHSFPVGPLFEGQIEAVPLVDALKLESEGWATIIKPDSLHWVCKEKGSALAESILTLLRKLQYAELMLQELEREMLAEKGLGAFLGENPKKAYLDEYVNIASSLLSNILYKLLDENSTFFRYELAAAIYSTAGKNPKVQNITVIPKTSRQ
ncbi:MAG: hypothetical protein J7L44_02160 [Candidatus Diapherotrites archaeon]|nr:hypothetical protein [Candidatus Diapherotrites archaeon]